MRELKPSIDAQYRTLDRRSDTFVVGSSMGALVSRAYVQRFEGKQRVRRFVSISGPQHGTATAWALPYVVGKPAVERLLGRGHTVRAGSRTDLSARDDADVRWVTVDRETGQGVGTAVEGAHAVVDAGDLRARCRPAR